MKTTTNASVKAALNARAEAAIAGTEATRALIDALLSADIVELFHGVTDEREFRKREKIVRADIVSVLAGSGRGVSAIDRETRLAVNIIRGRFFLGLRRMQELRKSADSLTALSGAVDIALRRTRSHSSDPTLAAYEKLERYIVKTVVDGAGVNSARVLARLREQISEDGVWLPRSL